MSMRAVSGWPDHVTCLAVEKHAVPIASVKIPSDLCHFPRSVNSPRSVFAAKWIVALAALSFVAPVTSSPAQSAEKASSGPVRNVVLLSEAKDSASARHGISKLEEALRARGVTVSENPGDVSAADKVILAGLSGGGGPAVETLGSAAPTGPESLAVRVGALYLKRPAIVLYGGDGVGLMYAALDLAQRVTWTTAGSDPFTFARNTDERPFLRDRGVVIFTMNRAYFESRLHDSKYLERYFDMLAEDRINELVLTFGYEDGGYMAPLYPYFFNVDGFPDVKVVDLTSDEQQRNLDSFRTMIRLATERGIRIKPGIWEHIYRGARGAGQDGKVAWASDGTHPTPGLVWGLNAENLVPYTVAALDKFYALFPEIKETQFRMHNESGLYDPEIEPFWHEIFHFYSTRRPEIELELRAKGLPKSVIRDAQAQGVRVHIDTKIWMEQMGLPYHPTHINTQDQGNARQGYADLLEYPKTYSLNWTLWNGGTQRLLEWADPDYARRMAQNARLYDGHGFAFTEMEATKMLSDPPNDPPRDFLSSRYKYFDYEFERYWAFYRVMGRLAYNPDTSSDVWAQEYIRRFGPNAGPHVMRAIELSSRVLPRVIAASVPYSMFPTTMGWPEMMHISSLPTYAAREEGSDIAQFENVRDAAKRILTGGDTAMRRPEDISRWFTQTSSNILSEVAAAEQASHGVTSKELKATLTDAKILAGLARYHAARQLGAVAYNLYTMSGSLPAFDEAVTYERKAVEAWREIINAAGDQYIDDMYFGTSLRGFPHHWKDELPALEKDFAALQAERQAAQPKPGARAVLPLEANPQPPSVTLIPASSNAVHPGADLTVRAKVTAPAGVRWIRLRYRHVNQKEDYQTLPMAEEGSAGLYSASIPGAFITAQWDVMYYVEIVDGRGTGRIYPDLEQETPYVIQPVAH
jgi:hypothetical protein